MQKADKQTNRKSNLKGKEKKGKDNKVLRGKKHRATDKFCIKFSPEKPKNKIEAKGKITHYFNPKGAKSKLQHLDNPTRSKPNYLEMEINTLEGEMVANSSGNSHPEPQTMEEAELEIRSEFSVKVIILTFL